MKGDQALRNSLVDYFSEGASWRVGMYLKRRGGLDGGFESFKLPFIGKANSPFFACAELQQIHSPLHLKRGAGAVIINTIC